MKKVLLSLFVVLAAASFVAPDAQARRLGGGTTSGMKRQTPPAQPAQPVPAKPADAAAQTPTGAAAAAPAAIAYACGMQGLYDRIVLGFFVACGVSRLARYNVTAEKLAEGSDKVKYFEGTPIPTSLVLVIVLAVAAAQGALGSELWFGMVHIAGYKLHPLVLMFALSGSLMISRIRIPKL